MSPRLRWLLLCLLLLSDHLCRPLSASPLVRRSAAVGENSANFSGTANLIQQTSEHLKSRAAQRIASLSTQLQTMRSSLVDLNGSVTCQELANEPFRNSSKWPIFARDLVSVALVPLLGALGCLQEAEMLLLRLYEDLGVSDAEEVLLQVQELIEGKWGKVVPTASHPDRRQEHQLNALFFNIEQIASQFPQDLTSNEIQDGISWTGKECQRWQQVNGTRLVGSAMQEHHLLASAIQECENLGPQCAGVRGSATHGLFHAVYRKGSCIVPEVGTESWILECQDMMQHTLVKRSLQSECIDQTEEKVSRVVEWIPAVSTLYNLGTAVYYAAAQCTEVAKERAILLAVDVGTDALMAITGGTAGIAGYAVGAGVKTSLKAGIKYLMNMMKQDEDLVFEEQDWSAVIIE
ncbi:uncharacterized protein apof [Polypterus senegalus]